MTGRWVLPAIGLLSSSAFAAELNGYLGAEQRGFFERGAHSSKSGVSSLIVEPELLAHSPDGTQTVIVRPFYRWDSEDENRTHFDVRELAVEVQRNQVDLRMGIRKVFWGVAESQHVVDIVNQTDLVESLELEQKLGQPMLNVNWRPSFASFEMYLLPRFREREFKEPGTRLGSAVEVGDAQYEHPDADKHVDVAARVQFALGEALDVAVSHFRGTNREPRLTLQDAAGGEELVPHYSIIRQTGFELQWIKGSVALKNETFYRAETGEDTVRAVAGIEYTLFQIAESRSDLGLILEHNYDSRGQQALTALQKDLFAGTRLSFNNEDSSELIAGVFVDLDHHSVSGKIEWKHRFTPSLTATLNAYSFHKSKQAEPQYVIRDDGYVEIGLFYHL